MIIKSRPLRRLEIGLVQQCVSLVSAQTLPSMTGHLHEWIRRKRHNKAIEQS
ncbi:hypothetical protein Plhal304r1_c037g0112601 [Plasmopara halstedii]